MGTRCGTKCPVQAEDEAGNIGKWERGDDQMAQLAEDRRDVLLVEP